MPLRNRIFIVALACVFVGSGAMFLRQMLQDHADEDAYQEAQELVALPPLPELSAEDLEPLPEEPPLQEEGAVGGTAPTVGAGKTGTAHSDPYADVLRTMDLGALQALNGDCKGWILIPNTKISYPLMQGTDNSYYLKHNYKKNTTAAGAIFLDSRNTAELTDFNSIVYGHRMKNGTMFESLKKYKGLAYWREHPYVYITLPGEKSYQYTIFAAYEESADGQSYRTSFGGDMEAKQAFLDHAVGASLIKTEVSVNAKDRILTLSTCTGRGYDKRLVVHAKLTGGDQLSLSEAEGAGEPPKELPETVTQVTEAEEAPVSPEADTQNEPEGEAD